MYKVYTDGLQHHRKGKWYFFQDMETIDDVIDYCRHFGFFFKGKDKNGVCYYGDGWHNYIAARPQGGKR